MKYWKQGFYDEPVKGSVEIEDSYYHQLLDGQSSGKEIETSPNGYPILVEHEYTIDELRNLKLSEIQRYDKSDTINSFTFKGRNSWFDKSTRVGLINSINIEQQAAKTATTLWIAQTKHSIPIDRAIQMLNSLELYALNCYNVTQSHLAAVSLLDTKTDIDSYDFKIGYPNKVIFTQ